MESGGLYPGKPVETFWMKEAKANRKLVLVVSGLRFGVQHVFYREPHRPLQNPPASPAQPSSDCLDPDTRRCTQTCKETRLLQRSARHDGLTSPLRRPLPPQIEVLVHQLRQAPPVSVLQSRPEGRTTRDALRGIPWLFIAQQGDACIFFNKVFMVESSNRPGLIGELCEGLHGLDYQRFS